MNTTTTMANGHSPIFQFIRKKTFGSILLMFTALLALILANSPFNGRIQWVLSQEIGFTIGNFSIYKPLLKWINDGLMSIFFFVVGLELKREILAGELSNPKNVAMPMVAALGGMLFPALIYIVVNMSGSGEAMRGWGIPMATDIAFALGILYLLGSAVPVSLKVFLTALAIIDDIGAVLVVALYYTTDLEFYYLIIGFGFLGLMFALNSLGVRDVFIFGVLGITGVWLTFLLSGVHATVAAVLAAFAIPANRSIDKKKYVEEIKSLIEQFKVAKKSEKEEFLLSAKEENIIGEIKRISKESISPLQHLERSMHGIVAFLVMPIFALANAGVVLDTDFFSLIVSPVSLGVALGLLAGKVIGVYGLSMLGLKLGWYSMPKNITPAMLLGTSFLTAIGFTMSLFINTMAFENPEYIRQAKTAVLFASLIAGSAGYLILRRALRERGSGTLSAEIQLNEEVKQSV